VNHFYLAAVLFGVVLLLGSLVLGGKDTAHGGHDYDVSVAWAPVASIRFWIFLMTFGGGAGLAIDWLEGTGSDITLLSLGGALGIGWLSGVLAVGIIRSLSRGSASSQVDAKELVGVTGKLVLPVAAGKPGKVRLDVRGRVVDYIAHAVDDTGELLTGSSVLIVEPKTDGSVVVAKAVD
jgi:hypothetical protein